MKQKILFLEDSEDLGVVVKQLLEINNYQVEWCKNAANALDIFLKNNQDFNLLLVDVELPGLNGFDFIEEIVRLNAHVPFLFITARAEKEDRIRGLKFGASDYITKPFDIEELLLRIKNSIRWQMEKPNQTINVESVLLSVGDITYHKDQLCLYVNENSKEDLTPREAEVLEYLIRNANRIVRKDEILKEFWGGADYFKGRSLDTYISRLKKILQSSKLVSIENRYGVGWTFKTKDKE
jgi:DNA-binding response OmpR family regulator